MAGLLGGCLSWKLYHADQHTIIAIIRPYVHANRLIPERAEGSDHCDPV